MSVAIYMYVHMKELTPEWIRVMCGLIVRRVDSKKGPAMTLKMQDRNRKEGSKLQCGSQALEKPV